MLAVGLIAWYVSNGGPVLAVAALGLAAWLFVGTLVEWADRVKLFRAPLADSWSRARNLPRAAHGMTGDQIGGRTGTRLTRPAAKDGR